ncbi:MAG: hypothetical protein M5U26_20635 [Planctomycetota bacterium]|nr:hypothetical protein [Planctomycetota bacterium]
MKPLRHRLKVHDRYHVELKLRYALSRERPRENLEAELFFFLPASLDVNSGNYRQEEFYQDLHAYTRYGTPLMSLDEMLDAENERSPLARVARLRAQQGGATDEARARVVYELRVLAAIVRVQYRLESKKLRALLKAPTGEGGPARAVEAADALLERARRVSARLRELRAAWVAGARALEMARGFDYVDESLSLLLQELCAKLHRRFARYAPEDERARALRARLAAAIQDEDEHRLRACYPSLATAGASFAERRANEYYLYRKGVLKKFAQSVLFLNVRTGQGSRGAFYGLYALAAMTAMFVYVGAILFFFPSGQLDSLSAIVLAIVAYALKDRIKEGMKHYFNARMTGILRDRESRLVDRGPGQVEVGRSAEAFSYVPASRVPREVLELRDRSELSEIAEDGAPEVVLKYQRSTAVYAERVFQVRQRVDQLDEILRFSVANFLRHMDEPRKGLVAARQARAPGESGAAPRVRLRHVTALKVYHVNLVLRLRRGGAEPPVLKRYRLILTRDGIVRVEDHDRAKALALKPPEAAPADAASSPQLGPAPAEARSGI